MFWLIVPRLFVAKVIYLGSLLSRWRWSSCRASPPAERELCPGLLRGSATVLLHAHWRLHKIEGGVGWWAGEMASW